MRLFKNLNCFFDSLSRDIRMFNVKASLFCGTITLVFGIISWLIGGMANNAMLIYIFPRSAISISIMYFLWAIFFFMIGIIIGGIFFNHEKFRRRENTKMLIFLLFSYMFSLCIYPIFFKSISPFICFLIILVAIAFCFFAICISIKTYSLWTMLLGMHILWLFYNCYVSLAVSIIN